MRKMKKTLSILLILVMLLVMAPAVFADGGGRWVDYGGQWAYQKADGSWAYGWLKDGGSWYYLGGDGWMKTGWQEVGGDWYYFYGDGHMAANTTIDGCTINSDGVWVQNSSGTESAGGTDKWVDYGGRWAYQYADGSWAYDWKTIDGVRYYFGSDGYMKTGWQEISGKWYYFSGSGTVVTGWQKLDGSWYWFDTKGVMATGWKTIDGVKYYFNADGLMATGWKKIGNDWYYFYGSGEMAANTKIDGYTLNDKGVMVMVWNPDISFTTTDMYGSQYTDKVFADAKVTMLNLWAYWCGPCISELQDLQRLQNNYADRGLQVFGVSYSNWTSQNIAEFKRQGITYPSLIATDALSRKLETGSVPTTIFVDGNGHILCAEPYIGSRSYDAWASIVEGYLR